MRKYKYITIVGMLAIALLLVVPAVRRARIDAERQARKNGFRLCILLLSYDRFEAQPATYYGLNGEALYSWRLRESLLNAKVSPDQLKLRWDHPANNELQLEPGPFEYGYDGERDICVLAVTGPGTAFDPTAAPDWDHVVGQAIVIVEASKSSIHWMEPGDLDISTISESTSSLAEAGISSRFPDGVHIGFADGQVWFVSKSIPFNKLRKFFTLREAETSSRQDELDRTGSNSSDR